jgi:transposase
MLVTDGEGLPIGLLVESARKSEVRLAERTLQTVAVRRPRGRPRTRPERLVCDRGYDSRAFRRYLRRRGIRSCIPTRKRPAGWKARRGRPPVAEPQYYRTRWKIERTFAWLLSYRRIVVRWERHVSTYRGFVLIAMALICINRLLQ